MSIPELIAELERMAEIVKEQGYRPSDIDVLLPEHGHATGPKIWTEVSDVRFEKTDNGIYDVYLYE